MKIYAKGCSGDNVEVELIDFNKLGINVTVDKEKSAWLELNLIASSDLIIALLEIQRSVLSELE